MRRDPRGYAWAGEGPGAGSSGATLPLPGCAGRAGERPERAPGLGGQNVVGGPRSPPGLRWLGAGAVLAEGGRVGRRRGGHAHPEERCQGGRGAASTRRRGALAAGEGGARSEGTAGVGAVLIGGAGPGSGSPLPRE